MTVSLSSKSEARQQACSCTHLGVGTLSDLPQVVLGTSCDSSKEDLFRDAAAQSHAHPVQELLLGVQVLLLGQILGIAQPFAPRDDGDLVRTQNAEEPLPSVARAVSRQPHQWKLKSKRNAGRSSLGESVPEHGSSRELFLPFCETQLNLSVSRKEAW